MFGMIWIKTSFLISLYKNVTCCVYNIRNWVHDKDTWLFCLLSCVDYLQSYGGPRWAGPSWLFETDHRLLWKPPFSFHLTYIRFFQWILFNFAFNQEVDKGIAMSTGVWQGSHLPKHFFVSTWILYNLVH